MASFKQKFVSSVEMLDGMEDRLKKHKQTNLMHLMHLIKSPLFKQLVAVEESIEELAIIAKRRELQTENFDIKLSNGKLIYFSRNASHRKPVVTSRSASVKRSKSRKREKSEKKDSIKNNKIDFFTFTSTTDQFKTETFPLISLNEGSKRGVASMEASTESFGKLEKITKTNEDSSQTKENTNSPIDCAVDDSHESEFEGKFLEKYEAFEVLNDKKERLGYVMTEVNGDLKKEKSGNYEKLIKVGDNWVGAETNKLDLIKLLQNHHLKIRTKKHPGFENDCKTNNFDLIPLFENNKTETITANRAETESNGINTPHTVNSSTKTDASVGINQNPFSNYCTNLINNLNNSDETKSTHTPCLTSINATCEPNDTLYYLTTYPESFPNSLIVSDNEIKNDSSKLKTLLTLDTPVFTNNNTALTHGTKQTTTLPQPTKGNLKFSPKPTNKIINEHSDGLKTHFSFKPNSDPRHQIKLNDHNSTTQLHHSSLFYTESPPAGIQTKQENSSVTPKPKNFRTLKNFLSLNKTHKANIDQGIKANDDEKNELKINENKKIDENNNLDSVLDNRFCCRSTASVEDRMVLNTEWTQLKLLHLVNNGSGLGFGIIGGKSTGVVVKTIQEGGAADLDNTLKIGDHILQICDVNVRGLASEQVAAVLRQSGAHVRLLVARPLEELPLDIEQLDNGMYGSSMFAPVVPTRHLSQHIDQLNAMMSAYPDFIGFHEDGVLIERQEFEGGSTENSYEHTFPVMHKDQMNDSSDCVKTSSNVDFSTSSLNMSHDCEASINKSKTPKRLSLATVFEMSPLDISEQHINYSNEKEHSEKDKSLISRSEKSENETKTKIPSGNFQKPFDPPDVVESLECCVVKGEHGLGMAVVGYASDDENLTGLFVGSIVDGSDVFEKGLIKVNDQITALNGESIIGLSNQEVVDILKNSDREVTISIARHISGKKHDLLKCSFDFCRKSFVCEGRRRSSLRKLELATQRNDDAIKNEWKKFFESKKRKLEENGENFEKNDLNENEEELQIIVAHVMKLKQGGGLGMVLEGLMDDTGTFHPFHFIRSIYPRGPIAVNDKLKVGDEVLEVNGIRIHGTNRNGVVGILKNLPQSVCIVVARQKNRRKNYLQKTCKKNDKVSKFDELPVLNFGNNINNYMKSATFNDNLNRQNFKNIATNNEQHNGVKNSSTNKQDVETNKNVRLRSLSLEPVSKYKIWCDEVVTVELEKADAGLGFSVMEYKDLSNQNKSMILIRSLVPGGVTHKSRKIFPGDRLVFVNRISLYEANLNAAIAALKTTPKGKVVLGILKPLSIEPNTNDSFHEGSDRSKRYSQLETLSCDHFNNAFQKTNLSMSDSSSLLSLSPLLSPSFPSPAHLKNSQNSFHIRNDEAPLEFYLQHFYSNVSSPMSNASFPYDTNVPGRSKESDKTNRTPLNYSYDYSCCTKPYKLPLSSFQPSNLAYFNRPFSSPQHSKNNGKVFNNFPHSANFINSKKFKSEKTILNLDEMLFKASVPTSYSDTGMPNNFQHKQYFPKAISCSQKHFLQKHELQSKHKKANSKTSLQSPQKASIYPSVSASFSSPSSFLFRTDSKQTSILPLETISIKKENLPLGLSIEAYNLTQNPAKPLTNSIKANIGFIIKKISLGSVKKDGRLRVGDVIVAIGGTSVEGLTTFQAKSLLRNAMLTSDKIEITYLSGDSTNGCGKMAFNATVAEHLNKYFQDHGQILRNSHLNYDDLFHIADLIQASDEDSSLQLVRVDIKPKTSVKMRRRHLGLSLVGRLNKSGAYVKEVSKEGVFCVTGKILPEDLIIKVNESSVFNMNHLNVAASITKNINSKSDLSIYVLRTLDRRDKKFKYIDTSQNDLNVEKKESLKKALNFKDKTHINKKIANNEEKSDEAQNSMEGENSFEHVNQCLEDAISRCEHNPLDDPSNHTESPLRSFYSSNPFFNGGETSIENKKSSQKLGSFTSVDVETKEKLEKNNEKVLEKVFTEEIKIMSDNENYQFSETTREETEKSCLKVSPCNKKISTATSTTNLQKYQLNQNAEDKEENIPNKIIVIHKNSRPLGLDLIGGVTTVMKKLLVNEVLVGGLAEKDGRLRVGDEVLMINDETVKEASDDYANEVLRNEQNLIKLTISRKMNVFPPGAFEISRITLRRKSTKVGFGFTIVCREVDKLIFVSDIIKGGVAEMNGELLPGDQILTANQKSFLSTSLVDAVCVLKMCQEELILVIKRVKFVPGLLSDEENDNSSDAKG